MFFWSLMWPGLFPNQQQASFEHKTLDLLIIKILHLSLLKFGGFIVYFILGMMLFALPGFSPYWHLSHLNRLFSLKIELSLKTTSF